jgi:hypothetical protein
MTEVCYCAPVDGMDYFDLAVLRLNHVFDEITLADVSAFDAMNVAFIARPNIGDELVHYYFRPDGTLDRSEISPYGRVIGHFSRFVPVGSVRVEASSSDPAVRVAAFERPDGQWAVVLLNNRDDAVDAQITIHRAASPPTQFTVVTSQADSLWQAGQAVMAAHPIRLEARSVMTLSSQP